MLLRRSHCSFFCCIAGIKSNPKSYRQQRAHTGSHIWNRIRWWKYRKYICIHWFRPSDRFNGQIMPLKCKQCFGVWKRNKLNCEYFFCFSEWSTETGEKGSALLSWISFRHVSNPINVLKVKNRRLKAAKWLVEHAGKLHTTFVRIYFCRCFVFFFFILALFSCWLFTISNECT